MAGEPDGTTAGDRDGTPGAGRDVVRGREAPGTRGALDDREAPGGRQRVVEGGERSRGAALAAEGRLPPERVALVDLLDRLLAGGVVITGDLVLSIADIDLVRISLRALLMSVRSEEPLETLERGIRHGEL
ncbi:gas vesicle protein [Sphaerisporangium aureirubrum]|uniref:Gas vesicle protein n=1 Tax=Sphaerisporangium aureirubrum TaxID=1544736 RepID=A0ABW1NUP6_9ACTN